MLRPLGDCDLVFVHCFFPPASVGDPLDFSNSLFWADEDLEVDRLLLLSEGENPRVKSGDSIGTRRIVASRVGSALLSLSSLSLACADVSVVSSDMSWAALMPSLSPLMKDS